MLTFVCCSYFQFGPYGVVCITSLSVLRNGAFSFLVALFCNTATVINHYIYE